ncbi:divalent metal cation transporter FieF [Gammaproteobacteria bacterium 45_16_T64]|nr:divalent metal cation transporter FieF [Gammaproteobacteria bacterium 45_16_T64]
MDKAQETTFIRNDDQLLKLTTYASVLTAVILIAAKVFAWGSSGSLSVLASLIDSIMDTAASIISLIAVRYALIPADEDHRFGHGKAESLAGLGQAMFITGSAVFLLFHSVDRILNPREIVQVDVALAVMIFSIFATAALILFQRYTIRRTQSVAIKADSLHYLADLITNVGIVVALLLAQFGWSGVDPILAILIALYVLYSAWEIVREAANDLLDHELSEDIQQKILAVVKSHKEIKGVHDLRTRQSGRNKIVQFHVEVDRDLPLWKAHDVVEKVEANLLKVYPELDVIVHQDPYPML